MPLLKDAHATGIAVWMLSVTAVLVVARLVWSVIAWKRRCKAIEQLAERLDWTYLGVAREYTNALSDRPLFSKGWSRKNANVVLSGEADAQFWIFDYRYTVGSERHSRTHRQTVIAFPYLGVNLPAFELRPERLRHKIASLVGFQDIDLPEHPEFSSRFLLRGTDEASIRTLFDAGLIAALPAGRTPQIEAGGSCLICYRHRKMIPAEQIEQKLNEACAIRDAFVKRCRELGWAGGRPTDPAAESSTRFP